MRVKTLWPALFSPFILALYVACSSGDVLSAKDAGPLDASTSDARTDNSEIPCGPRFVLTDVCQQCHARPPLNGAPFPLVNRSDILAMRGGAVVRDLMIEQVKARRMPLSPVTITDAQREVLVDWLEEGAPAIPSQGCTRPEEDAGSDAQADASDDGDGGDSDGGDDGGDAGGD